MGKLLSLVVIMTPLTKEELQQDIQAMLENLYLAGYRDSTRRASGKTPQAHATTNKIMSLIEQYGVQERIDELSWARNYAFTELHDCCYMTNEEMIDEIDERIAQLNQKESK